MKLDDKMQPKIFVDAMFGKLGRFLRLLGFDTEIANVSWKDEQIMEKAIQTNKLLITRDLEFYQIMFKTLKELNLDQNLTLYLNEQNIRDELIGFFQHLKINPSIFLWNERLKLPFEPRCSICNSQLNIAEKESIKSEIKEGTYKNYFNFWKCENEQCGKIYWRGNHWDEILHILEDVIKNGGFL